MNEQDKMGLRAAEGWLELGDVLSASNALEEITAGARANHAVLKQRYAIYAVAGRWDMAAEVAEGLAALLPDKPESWINLARARRKMDQTTEAKRILIVAAVKFTRVYQIPFNLACYCARLNEIDDARHWLKKAMLLDEKTVKKLAVDDPDLKPLWDSMSGEFCKGK